MKIFLTSFQIKKTNNFFGFYSGLRGIILALLFVCPDVKPVDPITVAVIGGAGAMTFRAFSKTIIGKIAIAYALARAAQTPAGKYVAMQIQNRTEEKFSQKYIKMRQRFGIKTLALRARMASSLSLCLGQADLKNQACDVSKNNQAEMFSFCEQAFSCIEEKSSKIKQECLQGESSNKSNYQKKPQCHIHVNQPNTYQNIYVAPGAAFVSFHSEAKKSSASEQSFWKGVCVGGFMGATTMALIDNKREDRLLDYLLCEKSG